jgi:hypothetical protein
MLIAEVTKRSVARWTRPRSGNKLLASAVIIGAAFAGWQTRDQWVPLVPGLAPGV